MKIANFALYLTAEILDLVQWLYKSDEIAVLGGERDYRALIYLCALFFLTSGN